MHLGDDVVDLLLGLGHHFAGLLAELVSATDRRFEQRGERRTHFRHILRRQHRRNAKRNAGKQRDLKKGRPNRNDPDRSDDRHGFIVAVADEKVGRVVRFVSRCGFHCTEISVIGSIVLRNRRWKSLGGHSVCV
jgi:hypothetical protein